MIHNDNLEKKLGMTTITNPQRSQWTGWEMFLKDE